MAIFVIKRCGFSPHAVCIDYALRFIFIVKTLQVNNSAKYEYAFINNISRLETCSEIKLIS